MGPHRLRVLFLGACVKFSDIHVNLDGLRETTAGEWLLRFIFGGLVSVVAGVAGLKWGPVVGGLFLGFPSIMPATMTLVKKHRGREQAIEDTRGTIFGSIALVLFAASIWFASERGYDPGLGLIFGAIVWATSGVAIWRALA